MAAARDADVQRLLEIASTLDDALAALPQGGEPARRVSSALRRLHQEVARVEEGLAQPAQ